MSGRMRDVQEQSCIDRALVKEGAATVVMVMKSLRNNEKTTLLSAKTEELKQAMKGSRGKVGN